ncbi:MAG: nucleotidyltransferase domain-containing protein [Anaerolineae bacterium]|nr:nucleotidyltransferase domain-containing protein [Anaerolineae bacterium]
MSLSKREIEQQIPLLVNRLQGLDVAKVILFGSFAYGKPSEVSDIDLMVVLNSDFYPTTYQEKSDLYLQVARVIRDIRQQVPVDLIVHTNAMHERFMEMNSLFAKEIRQKGKVIYEADH